MVFILLFYFFSAQGFMCGEAGFPVKRYQGGDKL